MANVSAGMTGEAARDAFAGNFFGSLPDVYCSNLDVMLVLNADGRYAIQKHCQTGSTRHADDRGVWSVTWNDTCVQLIPDNDALLGREFAIHDQDLLVLTEGSCIEPVEHPDGRSLRRARTPQPEN